MQETYEEQKRKRALHQDKDEKVKETKKVNKQFKGCIISGMI